MNIGITGTRAGLTEHQLNTVEKILRDMKYKSMFTSLHHGDCKGADESVHYIAQKLKIPIIIHPPMKSKHRAFCKGATVLAQYPYLLRNQNIVDASDKVIALPGQDNEVLRSGTWATIRYAKKTGKELIIIYPGVK